MSNSALHPNPFAGPIPFGSSRAERFRQKQIEATYALAYEQRTANMIAAARLSPDAERALLPSILERVGMPSGNAS